MYPQHSIYSPDNRRADFLRVQKFLQSKQINPNEVIIAQNILRLEAVLSASKNQYELQVRSTTGADRDLEVKLNQNDLFFTTDIALCIRKQDTSTDPQKQGNYPLYTFPDPNYFVGNQTAGGTTEAECLETIYNGLLTVKTKPVERLSELSTHIFRYAPNKQTFLQAGSQVGDEPAEYGPSFEGMGYRRMHPNLILNGFDNNSLTLTLGAGNTSEIAGGKDAAGDAVNTSNVLTILLLGYTAKNAAQKMGRFGTGL
jgi:hypothetical protein